MAQLMRCKRGCDNLPTKYGWICVERGEKSEDRLSETGSNAEEAVCFPRLSVRLLVSGWRGYFQVELTRTESLRYGQQAPHPVMLFQLVQNSGLRTQSPRTGADRGWRVAAHLRQWALGKAGRAVREEGSVASHFLQRSELCGPIRRA